jgi:isopenicillin N synthase-like dioxygenase
MTTIPIIDFASFLSGNKNTQHKVVQEIYLACQEVGFFYLKNHGISQELVDRLLSQSQSFFSLPETVKNRVLRSPQTNCGYVGFQKEKLNPQHPWDLKEAFNVGQETVWIPELEEFRQAVTQFYELTTQVIAPQLLQAFALTLELPPNFFEDKHGKNYFLRLLHYPPVAQTPQPGQLRAGEHSDYGSITLLLQDTVGGLEVQTRQQEWIVAPPIPGTLVVNVGDAMQHWTNNRLRSTPHRVAVPLDERAKISRYSIALFCDPNPDVELACLESCCSLDHPPVYESILMRDFLSRKFNATY